VSTRKIDNVCFGSVKATKKQAKQPAQYYSPQLSATLKPILERFGFVKFGFPPSQWAKKSPEPKSRRT